MICMFVVLHMFLPLFKLKLRKLVCCHLQHTFSLQPHKCWICLSRSFQIPLPVKLQLCRTHTQTRPSVTWPVATPWTFSWESGWRGRWPPSTGTCRVVRSRCRQVPWRFLSLSSPSLPSWRWASCCTGAGLTSAESWGARAGTASSPRSFSSACGFSTSSFPVWRLTVI